MPGRKFSPANSGYRYGFNGKELDKETTGTSTYDYGFRIYNPALGRFLSVDPLTKTYPELTPYQFASNTPIEAIDLDGLESLSSKIGAFSICFGKSVLNGIGALYHAIGDNPNHSGYDINPKKVKIDDIKRHETNWSQQLDPTWQIQNFSINLVYGTTNFVGGIIDGDGKRTAQAVPPLLSSVGTVAGLRGLPVTKLKALTSRIDNVILPSTSPKFNPSKPALAGKNMNIPASKNGYAPDFSGTNYLYKTKGNEQNIVQIKLTGSLTDDFVAANKVARLNEKPTGYTWHHLDDYNPSTGMATLQLVETKVHIKTVPHTGSVKQYEVANNTTYNK